MKGSKKSAILAILSVMDGALAIVSIAQSQQTVQFGTSSLCVSTFITHLSALPATDSSSEFNYYYNWICGLFENAILGPHSACNFADHSGTLASQNNSFSVVQLGNLNSRGAINFKDTVIFASEVIAYSYSPMHTPEL